MPNKPRLIPVLLFIAALSFGCIYSSIKKNEELNRNFVYRHRNEPELGSFVELTNIRLSSSTIVTGERVPNLLIDVKNNSTSSIDEVWGTITFRDSSGKTLKEDQDQCLFGAINDADRLAPGATHLDQEGILLIDKPTENVSVKVTHAWATSSALHE